MKGIIGFLIILIICIIVIYKIYDSRKDGTYYFNKMIQFTGQKKYSAALSALEKAVYLSPAKYYKNYKVYNARYQLYLKLNNGEMAISDLGTAIKLCKNIEDLIYLLDTRSYLYLSRNRIKDALNDINDALEKDFNFELTLHKVLIYIYDSQWELAIQLIDDLINKNIEGTEICYLYRAVVNSLCGNNNKAFEDLKFIISGKGKQDIIYLAKLYYKSMQNNDIDYNTVINNFSIQDMHRYLITKAILKKSVNSIPYLINSLNHDESVYRSQCASTLTWIGAPAIPKLMASLTKKEIAPTIRFILINIGEETISYFMDAIENEEDNYIIANTPFIFKNISDIGIKTLFDSIEYEKNNYNFYITLNQFDIHYLIKSIESFFDTKITRANKLFDKKQYIHAHKEYSKIINISWGIVSGYLLSYSGNIKENEYKRAIKNLESALMFLSNCNNYIINSFDSCLKIEKNESEITPIKIQTDQEYFYTFFNLENFESTKANMIIELILCYMNIGELYFAQKYFIQNKKYLYFNSVIDKDNIRILEYKLSELVLKKKITLEKPKERDNSSFLIYNDGLHEYSNEFINKLKLAEELQLKMKFNDVFNICSEIIYQNPSMGINNDLFRDGKLNAIRFRANLYVKLGYFDSALEDYILLSNIDRASDYATEIESVRSVLQK